MSARQTFEEAVAEDEKANAEACARRAVESQD